MVCEITKKFSFSLIIEKAKILQELVGIEQLIFFIPKKGSSL